MEIKIKHLIYAIALCLVMISSQGKTIQAATSGSMKVSGGGTVRVGDTVTITVTGQGNGPLYAVDFNVSYDPSILEHKGSTGLIYYVTDLNGEKKTSQTYKFKALKVGKSNIQVSNATGVGGPKSGNKHFQMSGSSTSVTVAPPKVASTDSSLKSLQLLETGITPSFSSTTTAYKATVPNEVSSVSVSAVPNHRGGRVTSITGTKLEVGENRVSVVVAAENGAKTTYTINVTRKDELPPLEVDTGKGGVLYTRRKMSESILPESFVKEEITYKDEKIDVAKSEVWDLTLFYLMDKDLTKGDFYVYDEANKTFVKYIELEASGGRYIILTPEEALSVPEYYTQVNFTAKEKEIEGWQLEGSKDGDFFLVYAMNGLGEKGLYHYDSLGNSFQRFSQDILASLDQAQEKIQDGEDAIKNLEKEKDGEIQEVEKQLEKLDEEKTLSEDLYENDIKLKKKFIIILSITTALSLIALIVLFVKDHLKKKKDGEKVEKIEKKTEEKTDKEKENNEDKANYENK